MKLHLQIWRQKSPQEQGRFVDYDLDDVSPHMSLLEMLDVLNQKLIAKGEDPVGFEHDCREGICGSCGFVINGIAHGPQTGTTVCQLHMRHFNDGDTLVLEPWRAAAFPLLKDLIVDRSALDRIIEAGGFISVRTGAAAEANEMLVSKETSELAMDAAECIECGACVAACPNGSAALFTSAKIAHLGLLPQGQPERDRRVLGMLEAANEQGFGSCSNHRECEAVCPKRISIHFIAFANRDYHRASRNKFPGTGGKR